MSIEKIIRENEAELYFAKAEALKKVAAIITDTARMYRGKYDEIRKVKTDDNRS